MKRGSRGYTNWSSQSETRVLARRGAGQLDARQSRAELLGLDGPQRLGPGRAGEHRRGDPAELVTEPELADPPRQVVQREALTGRIRGPDISGGPGCSGCEQRRQVKLTIEPFTILVQQRRPGRRR